MATKVAGGARPTTAELENEVFDLVTLSPLTRAEIAALLERVAARVKAIPVLKATPL